MNQTKTTLVTAFALFSLFFGAGNLILPPYLGLQAGDSWQLVCFGFIISAVLVPVLGILAHARIQGGIYDFAVKVSPWFSLLYCFLIYAISLALPSPRTASVTHEMAIAPWLGSPPIWTSLVYFILVLIFAMNRSRLLDLVGKFLTPAILLILLAIIGTEIFLPHNPAESYTLENAFSLGVLEGYQTFDAIGAVVVGGVIIISVNLQHGSMNFKEKRNLIGRAGILAGLGLLLIYAGLIFSGAGLGDLVAEDITRTNLLKYLSEITLGSGANIGLSTLVSLACFTTAVGIVTGSADFIASRFNGSRLAYKITVFTGCLIGVLVGQFEVGLIIDFAFPALMFIYPLTIALILLNVLPERYAPALVFKVVVAVTLLFSIPDFLNAIPSERATPYSFPLIPFQEEQLGWGIPALLGFGLAHLYLAAKR